MQFVEKKRFKNKAQDGHGSMVKRTDLLLFSINTCYTQSHFENTFGQMFMLNSVSVIGCRFGNCMVFP